MFFLITKAFELRLLNFFWSTDNSQQSTDFEYAVFLAMGCELWAMGTFAHCSWLIAHSKK